MSPSATNRLIVVGLLVVTGIGAVDATISREWDLLVILVVALALSSVLVARLESKRPEIPVRRDLVAWLRERAAVSGETIGALTDRALMAYRERYGQAPSSSDEAPR
jgi:hypothetical protein